jgi:hypothetical protein
MPGLIFGNLAALYPGGLDAGADTGLFTGVEHICPPGKEWMQPQCFTQPCPGFCVPSGGFHVQGGPAGGPTSPTANEDEDGKIITDETPSVHKIIHPFGEDPLDWLRLGGLIAAAWFLFKMYERHNDS